MIADFYQASTILQIILLVISQFAMISLAAGFILLFKRRCKVSKMIGMGAVLLLDITLYILMQLDSRITGAEQGLHLPIPYVVLLVVTLLNFALGIWLILSETKYRKTINNTSIREAFDNLPTGVCFFNKRGLPVLCNYAMQRFSFAVCGEDIQYVTDLSRCFSEDFTPPTDAKKDGNVFVFPDGRAWYLEKRAMTDEHDKHYWQYTASDVTDLYDNRVELQERTEQLRRAQAALQALSANVVAVTREEEILNTKMRVHDEMGRCLLAAQKYLRADSNEIIPDSVALAWQRAVSMIKYNNESADEDMLLQIRETCKFVKLGFVQTGELPKEETAAYILTCAVRECVTNAVRYAEATELYADFSETEDEATVVVYNNGKRPEGEIVEGGGLSTLRRRVERAGGSMVVQSRPRFKLTVTIAKGGIGVS